MLVSTSCKWPCSYIVLIVLCIMHELHDCSLHRMRLLSGTTCNMCGTSSSLPPHEALLLLQIEPLPNTLATVPNILTASNINKQLGRRMSRSASRKQDDQASQGSGHSSASRSFKTCLAKQNPASPLNAFGRHCGQKCLHDMLSSPDCMTSCGVWFVPISVHTLACRGLF